MQKPVETPEQARDRVLIAWQEAAKVLEAAKADEMAKRKEAFPVVFGTDAKEGTNRVALGNGYSVKGIRKINYKLDADLTKVNAAYDAVLGLGNEGPFLAERILKRVYDFGAGEYKKLDPANPTHAAAKLAIDAVMTTSDGVPSLEIEAPKVKG